MARPESFTQELADAICARIADGGSLRAICESEGMPSRRTVFRWLADTGMEQFRRQYAYAREVQAEGVFEEILEIADDGSNDYMTITKGDETYNVEDREVTGRSKLRVDTRRWALSKMLPKKYGEKLDVTSDGRPIQQITGMTVRPEEKNGD